jgi:hypothetical protein
MFNFPGELPVIELEGIKVIHDTWIETRSVRVIGQCVTLNEGDVVDPDSRCRICQAIQQNVYEMNAYMMNITAKSQALPLFYRPEDLVESTDNEGDQEGEWIKF